ncbi:MAG: UPF0104 family protein, partial [Pseudonocardiales bacterium]|nr:UPF0104 family protein [Pseudonocardiales bacterium]
FDAGCLAACAAALSVHGLTLPLLLVAYTAGMATSGLSLIPGGIGVVEPALILALVAGGVPAAAAMPAVVLYRLISLVGVVAAGWIVFAVQQWRRHPVTVEAAPSQHDARDQHVSTSSQRPHPPSGTDTHRPPSCSPSRGANRPATRCCSPAITAHCSSRARAVRQRSDRDPTMAVRVSLGSDRAGDEAFRGHREHPATTCKYFT